MPLQLSSGLFAGVLHPTSLLIIAYNSVRCHNGLACWTGGH